MNKTKNNAHIITFLYWFILLVWQNVRSATNRGGIDIIIKGGLILFLTGYYLYKSKKIRTVPLIFASIFTVMTLEIFISTGTSFSFFLSYFYPVLLYLIVYGIGAEFEITKKQLIFILDFLVICVAYIAVYAVLFCQDQFSSAFSITSAYGNELSSFLISNFEYGLYLTFGIVAIVLCLEFKKNLNIITKILYIVTLLLFLVNLILTYSRTSIISCLVILVIYSLFFKNGKIKYIVAILAVLFVIVWFVSPTIKSFIQEIVFKNNANSDRNELVKLGLNIFGDASMYHKFFGIPGYANIIAESSDHGNLHNGYLQVLIMNGIKGILALACIIFYEIKANLTIAKKYPEQKNIMVLFISFDIAACVVMIVTTSVLFFSSIDSYFLTMMTIVLPKFVRNSIIAGTFENE